MEFYEPSIGGAGNAFRRYAVGTNFVFHVGQCRELALPVSEKGGSWTVYFGFVRNGLQTKLADYLQKPHGAWVRFVPDIVGNPRYVDVRFYLRPNALEGSE